MLLEFRSSFPRFPEESRRLSDRVHKFGKCNSQRSNTLRRHFMWTFHETGYRNTRQESKDSHDSFSVTSVTDSSKKLWNVCWSRFPCVTGDTLFSRNNHKPGGFPGVTHMKLTCRSYIGNETLLCLFELEPSFEDFYLSIRQCHDGGQRRDLQDKLWKLRPR